MGQSCNNNKALKPNVLESLHQAHPGMSPKKSLAR